MNLEVLSPLTGERLLVSEFTVEDFRTISFLIETDSDLELYNFLTSKVSGYKNSVDIFFALLHARIHYVNNTITFNNGEAKVAFNLRLWDSNFKSNIGNITSTVEHEGFTIVLGYPQQCFYEQVADIFSECIYTITKNDSTLDFTKLCKIERLKVLEQLPSGLTDKVRGFILSHVDANILLMESRVNIPEIYINFFNNSVFAILKTLYNYYAYEDVLEILFILSKRIADIRFLSSRTPKDLEFLMRLYTEEVEKTNPETKSTI